VGVHLLSFAEFTNSQAPDGDLYGIIAIYAEENGFDSAGRTYCSASYLFKRIATSRV
jgi:hypothetical protein